jgi:hypothetical protein
VHPEPVSSWYEPLESNVAVIRVWSDEVLAGRGRSLSRARNSALYKDPRL